MDGLLMKLMLVAAEEVALVAAVGLKKALTEC